MVGGSSPSPGASFSPGPDLPDSHPDEPHGLLARQRRRRLVAATGLLLLGLVSVAAPAQAPAGVGASDERWYRVEVHGQAAGWAVERTIETEQEIRTEEEMRLTVSRGDVALSMRLATFFRETREGEPLEMGLRIEMGGAPIETTWRFVPGGLERRDGGGSVSAMEPLPPAGWLTPAAARRALQTRRSAGETRIELRSLYASFGGVPVEVLETRLVERESLALPSGEIKVARWHRVTAGAAGTRTEMTFFLDEKGREVRSMAEIAGLPMTLTLTSRDEARAAHGAPEMLAGTMVRPSRPIVSPRELERAVYRLSSRRSPRPALLSAELPSAGGQRAEVVEAGVRVLVATQPASSPKPEPERDLAPYLTASAYLDFQDPAVAELLSTALRDASESKAARAEALRRLVHRHVARKDLGTGFAAASAVARQRSGDCTEHSTLLAALLRGAGIPARLVSGLLYVEELAGQGGVFGYHMWVQAYLDGRWVDLDAITERPFDAAHIALLTTDLDGPEAFAELGARIASSLGALEVEVLETTYTEAPR